MASSGIGLLRVLLERLGVSPSRFSLEPSLLKQPVLSYLVSSCLQQRRNEFSLCQPSLLHRSIEALGSAGTPITSPAASLGDAAV